MRVLFFYVLFLIILLLYSGHSTSISQLKYSSMNKPLSDHSYQLVFVDEFNTNSLDTSKWLPFYLPQWSSRKQSKPNYHFNSGCLYLDITEDQEPWCPEFNGNVKCSSVQTGVFSGPKGSKIGQHRFFHPAPIVREAQDPQHTYLMQYGYIEIRAKAIRSPSNVVALWMIGYEDEPQRSAELCIVEIKGWQAKDQEALIGYGIHRFNDPALEEAFYEDQHVIDVTDFHVYGADWKKDRVDFYIDGKKVRTILQSPAYPMQLMLGVYEIPDQQKGKGGYIAPASFCIDYVRCYERKKES